METDEYRSSPVVAVHATRQPIRRHLADCDCPDDFPVLHELRAEGATDYVAFPLVFTDGTVHVATWSTRQPGGFTPQQFADLESIIAPLTRVAEIRALRRTATNLLNTYVGRQAGERILMGKIRRGFVEEIRAVDLALGHARLHRAVGAIAAAGAGRSAQPLFRLPGAADPRARRRGAEVHRRRTAGDFSAGGERRRRGRGLPPRARLRARGAGTDRRARQAGGRDSKARSASGSRCTSAR